MTQSGEQKRVRKLFKRLQQSPRLKFPREGGRLEAPDQRGVYIIYSPRGTVMHVGGTPRGKRGLHQRLRNHLAGQSSFARVKFDCNGSRLRMGYSYSFLIVSDQRVRTFLEAYAIGSLCPDHIGVGELVSESKSP